MFNNDFSADNKLKTELNFKSQTSKVKLNQALNTNYIEGHTELDLSQTAELHVLLRNHRLRFKFEKDHLEANMDLKKRHWHFQNKCL